MGVSIKTCYDRLERLTQFHRRYAQWSMAVIPKVTNSEGPSKCIVRCRQEIIRVVILQCFEPTGSPYEKSSINIQTHSCDIATRTGAVCFHTKRDVEWNSGPNPEMGFVSCRFQI